MRSSIKKFISLCARELPIQEPIFEFGSMQVEGQIGFADLRPYFPNKKYVGCDFREGTGVDMVLDCQSMSIMASNSVGTIICCDTLEHVEYPRDALKEFYRILKPGGVLIITSVMLWPIHGYPYDYWRYTPEGFRSLLKEFPTAYVDWNGLKENPHTVIGVGIKQKYPAEVFTGISRLQLARDQWRSVPDVPLWAKVLAPVVTVKKRLVL